MNPATPAAATTPSVGLQPHRWTIAEYRELYKTGLFFDKKTMLIDGVLYVMPMPEPPHDVGYRKDGLVRHLVPQ